MFYDYATLPLYIMLIIACKKWKTQICNHENKIWIHSFKRDIVTNIKQFDYLNN